MLMIISTAFIRSEAFYCRYRRRTQGARLRSRGKYSKEKNINLSVALRLGSMIKENYPEIKIVYTRTTDVFTTLQERADIVNDNKADIFFCIHTNATGGSSAHGTETYVLGLHKDKIKSGSSHE